MINHNDDKKWCDKWLKKVITFILYDNFTDNHDDPVCFGHQFLVE